MSRIRIQVLLFFLALSLQAANTYYVSSTGNDSGDGSQGSPWLTVQHAVSSMACGDTLNVVANGAFVAGDATLPYFANCTATTTIQSSALASFQPIGYRTNPVTDLANYGKLQFNSGIVAIPEAHGSNLNNTAGYECGISSITSDVFTLGNCSLPNLGNGSQVEFEVDNQWSLATSTVPSPLTILQKYYVTNCSTAPICGAVSSTFQLAASAGAPPITGITCTGTCVMNGVVVTEPLQVTVGSATITSPDPFSTWTTGTPIAFSAAGFQQFGTLPPPLALNTVYYITGTAARTFTVSLTPGGPPVTITGNGTGSLQASNTNLPSQWAFRGLEMTEVPGSLIYGFLILGNGFEASTIGMVSNMEVDRCYLHDQPGDTTPPVRGIAENGISAYIHDNYIVGMSTGEAQAIAGWGSPGPTKIINNFLEASGEDVLYGGNYSSSGTPNAHKVFTGNYFYRPPAWKVTASAGAASGPCFYDTTDPNHSGGEWYHDTAGAQWYQCSANGTWAPTNSTPTQGGNPLFKNLAEHKNGQFFTYSGNLFNYCWTQAQQGEAFNLNQEPGSGAGITNDHITVTNNAVYNVYRFLVRGSSCGYPSTIACPVEPSNHVVSNNLVVTTPLACGVGFPTGGQTCGYSPLQDTWGSATIQGSIFSHNTLYSSDTPFSNGNPTPLYGNGPTRACSFPPPINAMSYQNSIVFGDFAGDCAGAGGEISLYYTGSTFTNNALKGAAGNYSNVGSTNTWTKSVYPSTNSAIGYVNATGTMSGDYHLSPSSPYSAQNANASLLSTDGSDLGADIDLVKMATSGAAAGTPPWDQLAGLQVQPGASGVVFRYTAPTADACTGTIYGGAARIPSNQVSSLADTPGSNGSARELDISGLKASTQYWYSLACGNGVSLVGNFETRAQRRAQ